MRVRLFAPAVVAVLGVVTVPFHAPAAQVTASMSYPQQSFTSVDNYELTHAKIAASRSHFRKPITKPKPPHVNVHPSVSRETQHHAVHPQTSTTSTSAEVWAHQPFSIRVANCESGGGPNDHHTYYDGNPHLNDPNGHDGKWQFAPSTWYSVGGSGNAANASEAEQDYRAWLLWKRDGWGPWECAGIV